MKTLFIETKCKYDLSKLNISEISKKLPKKISIFYSIQYSNIAFKIKEYLSKKHDIENFSQVLGCSSPRISDKSEAILLISNGRFHAISLAHDKKIPVYLLEGGSIIEINKKDLENFEKRKKSSYLKFLNSNSCGIIISTKPGQENFGEAVKLKEDLSKKEKKSYLFISNNINESEFENFPPIESWINTACPRLDFTITNNSMINIRDLKE